MNNKIIVDHDAGFFSCCTIRLLRIVQFLNKEKIYPEVDSSLQFYMYKDNAGDATPFFFKTLQEEEPINNIIKYYNDDIDTQMSPYKELDFENINFLIKKYFSFSDLVMQSYDYLMSKYNIDFAKTIAVCYRGNDKHKETNIPSHEEILSKLDDVKSLNPDYKILIQSDEIDIYKKILYKYPDSLVFNEIFKIENNKNFSIAHFIPQGQRTNQAILFLGIMKILSQCVKLIINSGNVGMWLCLFRGNADGVYQYLNHKEYVYGVYNEQFKKNNTNFWI